MSRLTMLLFLVLTASILSLGYQVRAQNLAMATLSESVASLSASVYDIARQKGAGEVRLPTAEKPVLQMANPASQGCVEAGGELRIESRPDGGQFGACYFGERMACEEWAMFRGECPEGGVDISGAANAADRFCLITGHELTAAGDAETAGTCLVYEQECPAQEYFETGSCPGAIGE